MPDTGAPWYIPYVAGTDLVADWPTDSQTLATAIADGLDAAGSVVQVVYDEKSDTQSSSLAAGATTAITGLTASITPSSAANNVLVMVDVQGSADADAGFSVIVKRGGTAIGVGTTAGSRTSVTSGGGNALGSVLEAVSLHLLDSPATTSSTTYTVEIMNNRGTTQTIYVNRVQSDSDAVQVPRGQSRITLLEVNP